MFQVRSRVLAGAGAAGLTLAIAAGALAAGKVHPKAGTKYSGFTSALKFNGFRSAVTFKTSADGKRLLSFTYQSIGCFGGGGAFKPGVNYLKKPWNTHKVGTIAVSSDGKFSVKNAKSTFQVQGQKTVTISSVSGKFTNSKTATGKITFRQKFSGGGFAPQKCGPDSVTFTAKAK